MTTEMLPPGMGRCELTGKILPEDELVTINGQRVSAEGKALLLERLKAGEGLPGEAEKPTVMRRFGCILLDSVILWVPMAIIMFVAALAAGGAGVAGGGAGAIIGGAQVLTVVIVMGYFTLLHGSSGRTIGKMAGNLKVVRMDGQPMNMQTAFIRALAYQGFSIIPAVLLIVSPIAAQVVNVVVALYGLANVIAALVDTQQQRALHDRIAGTRVIMIPK